MTRAFTDGVLDGFEVKLARPARITELTAEWVGIRSNDQVSDPAFRKGLLQYLRQPLPGDSTVRSKSAAADPAAYAWMKSRRLLQHE